MLVEIYSGPFLKAVSQTLKRSLWPTISITCNDIMGLEVSWLYKTELKGEGLGLALECLDDLEFVF